MNIAEQRWLFKTPDYHIGQSLAERFQAFHEANPHVMTALRHEALTIKRRGVERVGIAFLFERLRWLYIMSTGGDDYKLNNSYRAFYARVLMSQEPELAEFFELREQKSL